MIVGDIKTYIQFSMKSRISRWLNPLFAFSSIITYILHDASDPNLMRVAASYMFSLMFVLHPARENRPDVGDPAPDFELAWASRDSIATEPFRLSNHLGKRSIVLAFYPADWSGGCTREMCTMRDDFTTISNLGVDVYGISGDYVFSHHEWAKHLNLPFPLLSDHNLEVARLYSSVNEDSRYSKRTVYVIDRNGLIAYVDLDYRVSTPDSYEKLKRTLGSTK